MPELFFKRPVSCSSDVKTYWSQSPEKADEDIKAVIAVGFYLFPSRTEKLSPLAPMVLHTSVGE